MVIPFPLSKLPNDAHYAGHPRCAMVYPACGGWACYIADDGGGVLIAEGVSKTDALQYAVDVALHWNAEIKLVNRWERL